MATAVGTDIMPREPASLPALRAAEHTDHPGFGPAIATVSLLSEWPMHLAPAYRRPHMPASGEAGMPHHDGPQPPRLDTSDQARPRHERRLSLTFRTILNQDGVND